MGNTIKSELATLLQRHGRVSADGARVLSTATLTKRSEVLYAAFRTIRELGYKIPSVRSLSGKHVVALAQAWAERGASASEQQTRLSILRTFSRWIHKPGLVESVGVRAPRRQYVARTDKSWSGHGISIEARLAQVRAADERVALALALQHAFGLRVREALLLRPHMADKTQYLDVHRGTKGGRERVVLIRTPEQRALLEQAKALVAHPLDSVAGPASKTYAQARRHYYHVVASCGITKAALGVTSHGLRHEYANEAFTRHLAIPSPLRGGDPRQMDLERVQQVRLDIAEDLGHSRLSVTTAYLGSFKNG